MKIRTGFVSNSSSSSFIVTQKRPDIIKEERDKINQTILEEYYGKGEVDQDRLDDFKDSIIIIHTSISSDNTDDDVTKMVKKLIKALGHDTNEFKVEMGDY